MSVSSGFVTTEQARSSASELEDAIMEVMNGERKAGKLPVEPMVRLIAYARQSIEGDGLGQKAEGKA